MLLKNIYLKKIRSKNRCKLISYDIFLINGESLLDTDSQEYVFKNIKPLIRRKYLSFLKKISKNKKCYVRIGYRSMNTKLMYEILSEFNKQEKWWDRSIIVNSYNWKNDKSNYWSSSTGFLLECNKKMFDYFFDNYWFSCCEEECEFLLYDVSFSQQFNKKTIMHPELLKKCPLKINNLMNGFHFRIEDGESSEELLKLVESFGKFSLTLPK